MKFSDLPLSEPIQKAIAEAGYTQPTPIQTEAIPPLLKGRDLLGCAQTGTGKTAAFALPILQRFSTEKRELQSGRTRALILTPTRELAIQIHENFRTYGRHLRFRSTVIFGGVGQSPQVQSVRHGVDVLIATPGRLLDLIGQKHVNLRDLEVFVLDEADRMLDMGFIHDVKRIIAMLPPRRQNLFFSATLPPEIIKLSQTLLTDPVRVEVTPVSSTAEKISQSVMFVEKSKKKELLKFVLQDPKLHRVIVFTRTKYGANQVSAVLEKNGIPSAAIHGNKSQNARQTALANFKAGKVRVLVATDIAARGIDVEGVSHVINYELPNIAESYVHRIGRTARAGAGGSAISFSDSEERAYLRDIERLTAQKIPLDKNHPFHSADIEAGPVLSKGKAKAALEAGERKQEAHRKKKRFFRRGPGKGSSGRSPAGRGPTGRDPQK